MRLASSQQDVEAVQRLRYQVFYEEFEAKPDSKMAETRRDINRFDEFTDLLMVIDDSLPESENIVGTYRLLRKDIADQHGGFYTSDEFDISPLINSKAILLELGRSCVLAPYRTRPVLQKLWGSIAEYVAEHNIGLMFGCASFPGVDPDAISQQLAYLHHYHLAPPELRPRALDELYVDMNRHDKESFDAKRIFASMPPLMKGYMRLGASIGDGAIIDHQWNSIDVCIVMPTHLVTSRYFSHYQRKTEKEIMIDSNFAESVPSMRRESTGS